MKLNLVASMLVLAFSGSAFAVLPPYYQSVREIKAIMDDAEVASRLGTGASISSVSRQDQNYIVVAGSCALPVAVEYIVRPDAPPGPAEFRLNVGTVACLP